MTCSILNQNRITCDDVFFISCADIIREKGLDKVTVDDLVTEVTPKARGMYIHALPTHKWPNLAVYECNHCND